MSNESKNNKNDQTHLNHQGEEARQSASDSTFPDVSVIDDKFDFATLSKTAKIKFSKEIKVKHSAAFILLQRAIDYIKEYNGVVRAQEQQLLTLQTELSDLTKKVKLYKPSHEQVLKAKNTHDLYLKKIDELNASSKYSAKKFIEKIIEPLNFFEKAIEHSYDLKLNQEMRQWLSGFELILDKLRNAILSEGLKEIPTKIGDKFNEKIHHAIEHETSPKLENGLITKIIRKGYTFHDLVLSHVLVRVVKNN